MFQKMSDYFQLFKSTSFFYLNILIWKNHAFFKALLSVQKLFKKCSKSIVEFSKHETWTISMFWQKRMLIILD